MVFCRIAKNKREIIFWRKVLKHEEAIAIGWNTTAWYSLYHGVVLSIPRCGTLNTTVWYCLYHALVLVVPNRGENLVRRVGGKKILVRSNSVQSFKHLVMSGLYCHIIYGARFSSDFYYICARFSSDFLLKPATFLNNFGL